jgi:hypothetical protein
VSDDDTLHIPPEIVQEHLDDLEPFMRDTIRIAHDHDDLTNLALQLARILSDQVRKDPRWLNAVIGQVVARIPADELVTTMSSGESFETLLSKYFPGGFDIG